MVKQISFTKYERETLPQFRDNLNKAESTEDVKKFFSYACQELCENIFAEKNLKLAYDDIVFTPNKDPFYRIEDALCSFENFSSILETSDLSHLLSKMALSAKNRHTRLEKHFDKTEAKIRR